MNVFQKLNYKYSVFGLWLYGKNVFFVPTHINCFYKTTWRGILKLHCKYRTVGRISESDVLRHKPSVNKGGVYRDIGFLKSHSTACRAAIC